MKRRKKMSKELSAIEARQQTIENLYKNLIFEAIDYESKLGHFELTIACQYVDDSSIDYLKAMGYSIENRQSRAGGGGKMIVKNFYRITWVN